MKENKNTSSSVQTVTLLKNTLETKFVDAMVLVTYHPRSVLAGGFELEDGIVEDLRKFKQPKLLYPKEKWPAVKLKKLGFDSEFDKDGVLLTGGVADNHCAVAVETSDRIGMAKLGSVVKKAKVLVGHSVSGDLDHLVLLGLATDDWLRGKNVRDSFLLARMHNENGGKGAYGLETLLLSEFNTDGWKAETEKLIKKTGNAADWTPEQRIARCRLDAWATVVLAEYFEKELLRDGEWSDHP